MLGMRRASQALCRAGLCRIAIDPCVAQLPQAMTAAGGAAGAPAAGAAMPPRAVAALGRHSFASEAVEAWDSLRQVCINSGTQRQQWVPWVPPPARVPHVGLLCVALASLTPKTCHPSANPGRASAA